MNIELTDITINDAIKTTDNICFLREEILSGFGVRIYGSGNVSYFIEPTINGKSKRKVIGKYPALSVTEARALA